MSVEDLIANASAVTPLEAPHVKLMLEGARLRPEPAFRWFELWCKVWLDPTSDAARARADAEIRRLIPPHTVAKLQILADEATK